MLKIGVFIIKFAKGFLNFSSSWNNLSKMLNTPPPSPLPKYENVSL